MAVKYMDGEEHGAHAADVDAVLCEPCMDRVSDQMLDLVKPDVVGQPKTDKLVGIWPDCKQRAFVAGAEWFQFVEYGSTMFGSERRDAEREAVKRYGDPMTQATEGNPHGNAGK